MKEAFVQAYKQIAEKCRILCDSLFLIRFSMPLSIKQKIIAYTCLFEHQDKIKNKKENKGLLTSADSVYIMNQASVEFAKQDAKKLKIGNQPYFPDNSFLISSKKHIKKLNIQEDTCSDPQNASASLPIMEGSITPSNPKP